MESEKETQIGDVTALYDAVVQMPQESSYSPPRKI